jgi:2-polyprenyl-6-methoxyphenol hydroxylase-like FAD-dependent oxidoreductase
MQVIIIGAGIGGTCLAHGLRKEGIAVRVLERDGARVSGLPGYGIHINPFGRQALQECLPGANWQRFQSKARAIGGKARFFDERLRPLATQDGLHVKDGRTIAENRLSISRAELREVLIGGLSEDETGQGGIIDWGKTFLRYEVLPGAKIRVHCIDGSWEDCDVLVGADGSNSRVRNQYLPSIQRFKVGATIVVGRTRITNEVREAFPADLIDGSPNSIVPSSPDWLFSSVWRAPVDTNAQLEDTRVESYAVWAYIAADRSYPDNLDNMPPDELCDFVLSRIARWDRRLHSLVKESERQSVSVVVLRSMPHLVSWRSSEVVLLGDAIHNMTPMAGVGANTALRDARLLTRALVAAATGRAPLRQSISDYEGQMRQYANAAVSLSLRNARNAVADSRLKRAVFRSLLRLAHAVPMVHHMVFSRRA